MPRPILTTACAAGLALAGSAALTACMQTAAAPDAPAAPAAAGQCFLPQQINGYSEAPDGPNGEGRFHVHTGGRDRWLFETGCTELAFTSRIALDTRFNGTRLCAGESAIVLVPRGAGAPDRCHARLLGKLPPR